jgi:hypothetical protein
VHDCAKLVCSSAPLQVCLSERPNILADLPHGLGAGSLVEAKLQVFASVFLIKTFIINHAQTRQSRLNYSDTLSQIATTQPNNDNLSKAPRHQRQRFTHCARCVASLKAKNKKKKKQTWEPSQSARDSRRLRIPVTSPCSFVRRPRFVAMESITEEAIEAEAAALMARLEELRRLRQVCVFCPRVFRWDRC